MGGEVPDPRGAVDEGKSVVSGDVAGGRLVVVALGEHVPGRPLLASLGGDLGAELVGGDAVAGAQLVDDAGLCPGCFGLLVAPCHGGLVGLRDALGGGLLPAALDAGEVGADCALLGGEAGLQLARLSLAGGLCAA